jgi:uncharacterized glyoxalase superfamily protein PhnB
MATLNPYLSFEGNCREAMYGDLTDKFGVRWMLNYEKS